MHQAVLRYTSTPVRLGFLHLCITSLGDSYSSCYACGYTSFSTRSYFLSSVKLRTRTSNSSPLLPHPGPSLPIFSWKPPLKKFMKRGNGRGLCPQIFLHHLQLALGVYFLMLNHVTPLLTPNSEIPWSLLHCPWNFPAKNTGVGCHFLRQGIFPTHWSNLHSLGSPAGWFFLPLRHLG